MMKKNKNTNFLDMIPIKRDKLRTKITDEGRLQIIVPRKGLLDKIVRLFLKTPRTMKIDLDDIGTWVWNSIDNKRNMGQIGEILKKEFGDQIEPVYERLAIYMKTLENNKFIKIQKT